MALFKQFNMEIITLKEDVRVKSCAQAEAQDLDGT